MIEILRLTEDETHRFVRDKVRDFANDVIRAPSSEDAIQKLREFVADVRRFIPDL